MRKSPFIALLAVALIGGAYALVSGLYPDNSQFPRVPTQPGTIGSALAKILGITDVANYAGDGTVANTNALSGITATGFLHGNNCATAGNVWLRTDATGKAVCGSKNTTLASIGTVQKNTCTAKAYRADGSIANLNNGNNILEGDIIQTDPGCSLTITFADLSLIRLDGGSTVSLDIGTDISGQSIAYAILNNGGLWGRVLTETGGYYIGSSDIVAGVRGTSINIEKYGANPAITFDVSKGRYVIMGAGGTGGGSTNLQIIHSRLPNTKMDCFGGTGVVSFSGVSRYPMHVYGIPGYCDSAKTQAESITDTMLPTIESLYMNERIAQNTVADLMYMKKKSNALGNGDKKNTIDAEIGITAPITVAEKKAICEYSTTQKIYWDSLLGTNVDVCQPDVIAFADLSSSSKLFFKNGKELEARYETGSSHDNILVNNGTFGIYTNPRSKVEWRTQATTAQQQSIWYYLDRNTPASPSCPAISKQAWVQGIYAKNPSNSSPIDIFACPNYAQYPDGIWYLSGVIQSPTYTAGSSDGGMRITQTGQYLTYPINSIGNLVGFSGGTLKEKKITIELDTEVPNTGKHYIMDLGNVSIWRDNGTYNLKTGSTGVSGTGLPITKNGYTLNLKDGDPKIIILTLATIAPTQLVIGNTPSFAPSYNFPIGTTIKKITISY